ncbi:MAG: PEP-CTERM sorting domain-containing protein [Pirellulaceae bacterium]|nr:PEP-CTERM sorting domain-containing protein [Pirellulaceae bacterium]
MRSTIGLAVLLVLGGLSASARAETVLYQDTFDSGSTTLNGTGLDVTSGLYGATSGATWTASSNWKVNTTATGDGNLGRAYVNATSSVNAAAWLPLTPQADCVYTLSASIYLESFSENYYAGLGFAYSSSTPSTSATLYSASKAWLAEINTGDYGSYNFGSYAKTTTIGSWTGSGTSWTTKSPGEGYNTLSIVLTTTDTWSASFYVNGTLERTVDFTSAPILTHVGFSTTGKYVQLDNFSLTVSPIPEPGTFALLAAGLVGLAVLGRRKRR